MRLMVIFWKSLAAQSFDALFSRDYGNALTGPSRRAGTAFDDPAQLAPGPRSREPDPDPEPPRRHPERQGPRRRAAGRLQRPLDPPPLDACQPVRDARHAGHGHCPRLLQRSEEHTSELQSLMRISYADLFCKNKNI